MTMTLHGNGRAIRRANQQRRTDAFLADAERLLGELFDTEAKLIKNPLLQHRGRLVLRHIVSARACNNGKDIML